MEYWLFLNTQCPRLIGVLILLFGAMVGSFLNVCIYRIPAKVSIVTPPSSCACGVRIPFYLNIPVLGWLFMRGEARCCGVKVSFRYPLVEMLSGLMFFACWMQMDSSIFWIGCIFTFILLAAGFIDFDTLEIPDRFSMGGTLVGIILSISFPLLHGIEPSEIVLESRRAGLVSSASGAVIGAGVYYWVAALGYILFKKDALGEGDVKLAGCIGAFCGWQGAVFSLLGGAVIGLLIAPIMYYVSKDKNWNRAEEGEEEPEGFGMPFGPPIALAGWLYFMGWDYGLLQLWSIY